MIIAGLPPALNSPVPIYTPGRREALLESKGSCPRTQCPQPGLKPGQLDLETSTLTMRLQYLLYLHVFAQRSKNSGKIVERN